MHCSGKSCVVLGKVKEKSQIFMHDMANAVRYTDLQINPTELVACSITPLARTAVKSNHPPLSPELSSSAGSPGEQLGGKPLSFWLF